MNTTPWFPSQFPAGIPNGQGSQVMEACWFPGGHGTLDSSENKENKSSQDFVQLIFNIWSFLLHVSKERA